MGERRAALGELRAEERARPVDGRQYVLELSAAELDEMRDGALHFRAAGAAFPAGFEVFLHKKARSRGQFAVNEKQDVFIGQMSAIAGQKVIYSPHHSTT